MKWIKIISISLVSLLLLIAGGLFILGKFYQEELVDLFEKELEKNLITKVDFGTVSLNTWSQFPNAAISIQNVVCMDPTEPKDTLFKAKELFLEFNLSDFFKGKYKVNSLSLNEGFVNASVSAKGIENYKIWKTPDSTSSSSFDLSLEQVNLVNIDFSYRNFKDQIALISDMHQVQFKGAFSKENQEFQLSGDMLMKRLRYADVHIQDHLPMLLSLGIQSSEGNYQINNSEVQLLGASSQLTGTISPSAYSLKLDAKNADLKTLAPYFPEAQRELLKRYEPEGKVNLNMSIDGGEGKTPKYSGSFDLKKASIKDLTSGLKLTSLSCDGKFDLTNKSAEAKLDLSNIEGKLNKGSLKGALSIDNFISPKIVLETNASLAWADVIPYLNWNKLEEVNGTFDAKLSFEGKFANLENIRKSELNSAKFNGELVTERLSFKLAEDNKQYKGIQAKLAFNNQELQINRFIGFIEESDFNISGACQNLLSYLLMPQQTLVVQANLESEKLNLDQLLSSTAGSNGDYQFTLSKYLEADIALSVKDLNFRRFEAKEVMGKLKLKDQQLSIDPMSLKTLEGAIDGNLRVDGRWKNLAISGTTICDKLNMEKLFYSFENFGQDVLQSDNIAGVATARIDWTGIWSPQLEIDQDKLMVNGNLKIEKGELINFEALTALSGYVELEELKHVKFQTLENNIRIVNKEIRIPDMKIRSSALTLEASGEHTFDNKIHYRIKLLLSELLSKKVMDEKPELYGEHGIIEDDGIRKTLYLEMLGTVANPIIRYDKRSLKKKIKDELVQEKEEIVELFKEQKEGEKPDTSKSTPIKETGFTIEWDDDPQEDDPDGLD